MFNILFTEARFWYLCTISKNDVTSSVR